MFRVPLRVKYGCPSQTTWVLVINALLSNLSVGLPIARKHEAAFKGMWMELGELMEDFLFSQSPAPANQSNDQCQRDEAIDCELIQLIREDILPYAKHVPREFIVKVMHILNRGSIHSHTMTAFIDTESSRKLREEFAKSCFETLLQFSFIMQQQTGGSTDEEGAITRLAVTALLQRCRDVMLKFVADERLSGKCPLPRPRMSEMSFVLKAASTLLITLKRAPPANVDQKIWDHVIGLYPVLVDCITSSSPQVCPALKEVLHEYRDLLSPPAGHATNGT
ncbi:hypothetical protein NP493_305g02023 [Ridgeia piscesae]|uniref:Mon2 C-terminal domain-containing protein n=1 Tax=Ridgeia piscesae TaxID=27915 RepID=A0AAD9NW59_RIDPI|nr:hypothetical protein NP493_305g02023 [Ridgeia piscesae]